LAKVCTFPRFVRSTSRLSIRCISATFYTKLDSGSHLHIQPSASAFFTGGAHDTCRVRWIFSLTAGTLGFNYCSLPPTLRIVHGSSSILIVLFERIGDLCIMESKFTSTANTTVYNGQLALRVSGRHSKWLTPPSVHLARKDRFRWRQRIGLCDLGFTVKHFYTSSEPISGQPHASRLSIMKCIVNTDLTRSLKFSICPRESRLDRYSPRTVVCVPHLHDAMGSPSTMHSHLPGYGRIL
jgi:hypothetical protein